MYSPEQATEKALESYKDSGRAINLRDMAFFWLLYALVVAVMGLKNEEKLPFDE